MQATTRYQTYLERPPGTVLPPKKVCNLDPMASRSRKKRHDHNLTLALAHGYAFSLVHAREAASRSDVVESSVLLTDAVKRLTRKLGANHPETRRAAKDLAMNRSILKRMDSAGADSVIYEK